MMKIWPYEEVNIYRNFQVCTKYSLFLFTMGLRNRKFGVLIHRKRISMQELFYINESHSMKKKHIFFPTKDIPDDIFSYDF